MILDENKTTPASSWTPIFFSLPVCGLMCVSVHLGICAQVGTHTQTQVGHTQTHMCTHITLLEIMLFLLFRKSSAGGCTSLFLYWTEGLKQQSVLENVINFALCVSIILTFLSFLPASWRVFRLHLLMPCWWEKFTILALECSFHGVPSTSIRRLCLV